MLFSRHCRLVLVWASFTCAPALPTDASLPDRLQPGPLHAVIEQLFGQTVLIYDDAHRERLESAARTALESINREGISARRVNEVGNAVEPHVIAALNLHGFRAGIPTTASGRQRSAGYPDIVASLDDALFYLEVKTYHPNNIATSQRSFYLSPSADPKVNAPGYHLLIAFAMEVEEDGRYFARTVRLLDIATLPLSLKLEFNASNRDLYDAGLELLAEP